MSLAALGRQSIRFRVDRRGNFAIIRGFAMVPIVGALGLGFEVSNWFMTKHARQNAADSAAIAAATKVSPNYNLEGMVAASNTAACPSRGNSCYSVTISSFSVPFFLSPVVDF